MTMTSVLDWDEEGIPWEAEAGYQSPRVARCECGHYWFQGMECHHCHREVE